MKYLFKIIYFIALFGGSLYFFGNAKDTWLSGGNVATTEATGCQLPILSFEYEKYSLDRLFGYTSEQDPLIIREQFITPLSDGVYRIAIDERGTDVRKMMYEVFDTTDGHRVTEGQISAFDYEDTGKYIRFKPDIDYDYGREYAVALTLITSESKRVYYYFRIKAYDVPALSEKLDFILKFSEKCRKKDHQYVIPYLESTYRGLSKSYSHVDITDSYQMVCWGNLTPEVISDISIEINELYKYIAVVTLKYTVAVDNASGHETYIISEKFRVQMGTGYAYLLNYVRDTEAVFDPALMSLSQGQLKLGVTGDTDVDILYTRDSSQLAFVRDGVLYYYNLPENKLSTVYSSNLGYDVPSEIYQSSGIKLLHMDDDGTLSYMVYGYINNGTYEGKTGLVVYEYYHHLNRVQEVLYLPLSMTYDQLKCELGGFAYMNGSDVFFFQLHRHIYSYNLATRELKEISTKELSADAVFLPGPAYAAWQQEGDMENIHLLYLETGERKTISVSDGEIIRLFSSIEDNLILGYGRADDMATYGDGTVYYPVTTIRILDSSEKVLKEYQKTGYYITEITSTNTSIKLTRVTRGAAGYKPASDEYILIKNVDETGDFAIASRATDQMLTEYYLSLPSKYDFKDIPRTGIAKLTVLTENTAVYLDELQAVADRYYVYSYGHLIAITDAVAPALSLADTNDTVGVVITGRGDVLWERGVMSRTGELLPDTITYGQDIYKKGLTDNTLSCIGASLSQMMYYVYKDIPVYAMYDEHTPILFTGYTGTTTTYINLKTGKSVSVYTSRLIPTLESNGNTFMIAK